MQDKISLANIYDPKQNALAGFFQKAPFISSKKSLQESGNQTLCEENVGRERSVRVYVGKYGGLGR